MSDENLPRYAGPETRNRSDKMTNEEIKQRFDNETAALYSQRKPAWLPEFEYTFGLVPQLVEPFAQPGTVILDLGAGTGNLTRTVMEKVEGIEAVLLDFSPNMLSEAAAVLKNFSGRFRTVEGDFGSADLGRGQYAAVVSSFAIHHLRADRDYLDLYRKIRAALTGPGIFVCCDVVAGASELLSRRNEAEWTDFLAARGFPRPEIERILSNYHVEDSPRDIGTHLRLLHEAGFDIADVVWKKANFAVYVGVAGKLTTDEHG
jgi:ubiquinone/menaquinone biosynthesis C-methylase UbiE